MPDGTQGFDPQDLKQGPISVGPAIVGIVADEPAQTVSASPAVEPPTQPTAPSATDKDKNAIAAAHAKIAAEDQERWNNFFQALMAATRGHVVSEKTAGQKTHTVLDQRQFLFERAEDFALAQNGAHFKMAGSSGFIDASPSGIFFKPLGQQPQNAADLNFTYADAQMMALFAAQNKDYQTVTLSGTRLQKQMIHTAIMEQNKYLPPEQQIKVKNPILGFKPKIKDFIPFPDFMASAQPTPATPEPAAEKAGETAVPELNETAATPAPVAASPYYFLPTGEKTAEAIPRAVFAIKTTETPDGDTGSFAVMDKDGKPEALIIETTDGIWRHPDIFRASDADHPKHPKFHQTQIDHVVDVFNNPKNNDVLYKANLGPDVPRVRVVTAQERQNQQIEKIQKLWDSAEEQLNANSGAALHKSLKIGNTDGKPPKRSVYEQSLTIDGVEIDVAYVQKTDRKTGEKRIEVMGIAGDTVPMIAAEDFSIKPLSKPAAKAVAEPAPAAAPEPVAQTTAPPVVEVVTTTTATTAKIPVIETVDPTEGSFAATQQAAANGPSPKEKLPRLVLNLEDRISAIDPQASIQTPNAGDAIFIAMQKMRGKAPGPSGPA